MQTTLKSGVPQYSFTAMDIYDVDFVEHRFDEMAATYERVNDISSFGRASCVNGFKP